MRRALSHWPGCPRASWMRGSSAAERPARASVVSAAATSAVEQGRVGGLQRAQRARERDLRPVDEGQPLLVREPHRAQARATQRATRVHLDAAHPHAALPDQREREERERRQVARRADAALAGHDREHVGLVEADQRLDRRGAHARPAPGERVDAEQERQADRLVGERVAGPERVGDEQVLLERRRVVLRDPVDRVAAESRRHAVDPLPALHRPLDARGGGGGTALGRGVPAQAARDRGRRAARPRARGGVRSRGPRGRLPGGTRGSPAFPSRAKCRSTSPPLEAGARPAAPRGTRQGCPSRVPRRKRRRFPTLAGVFTPSGASAWGRASGDEERVAL